MNNIFLYNQPILPKEFSFPKNYIEIAKNHSVINLNPWEFLYNDMAKSLYYYGSMLTTYKDRFLIPFAMTNDLSGLFNDGYVILACFDGNDYSGDPKVYFHDYGYLGTIPSWENRYFLKNFDEWLVKAKEDSTEYNQD